MLAVLAVLAMLLGAGAPLGLRALGGFVPAAAGASSHTIISRLILKQLLSFC